MIASTTNAADILARTLWGEARGEGERGMRAIAHVVLNRVSIAQAHGGKMWWGHDVPSVCRAPFQFSCWNKNDPNFSLMMAVDVHDPAFRQAQALALWVLSDPDLYDITRGATHYHRFDMSPKWAHGATVIARIGVHLFYRLDE